MKNLQNYLQIKLEIFPLKEASVAGTLHEALKGIAAEVTEDLLNVGLKKVGGNFIFLKKAVHVRHALFRIFLEIETDEIRLKNGLRLD